MGPRLFRRGNRHPHASRTASIVGLQWGHVFSDVEIEPGGAKSFVFSFFFNGATSFQTWKSPSRVNFLRSGLPLQWGHVFSDVEMPRSGSPRLGMYCIFNGATSFQTWKFDSRHRRRHEDVHLQWGHVFSDVEISMLEPSTVLSFVFNGATSFQTWKLGLSLGRKLVSNSSMGPRLFRRGNWPSPSAPKRTPTLFNGATSFQTWKSSNGGVIFLHSIHLQWGHVFSDVEIAPSRGLFQPRSEGLFSSTPEKKSTPLLPIRFSGSKEASGVVREAPGILPPPRLSKRLSPIVKEFRSPEPHAPPERRPFPPP